MSVIQSAHFYLLGISAPGAQKKLKKIVLQNFLKTIMLADFNIRNNGRKFENILLIFA
jgi:hypothetical protein